MILSSFMLMAAELPQSVETSIASVDKQGQVTLTNSVPSGMSGIVVHSYGSDFSAITYSIVSSGNQKATVTSYNLLDHNNLPSIKSPVQKGDKVIFGNFYHNALLIAPNKKVYDQLTNSIDRSWIHPDTYAMYLISKEEKHISLSNMKKFATENQIGLIAIVDKDKLMILDPISGKYLTQQALNVANAKAMSPFYARFEQITDSFWGDEEKQNFDEYYRGIGRLK